mgnify:CR=1 FL=1
MEDMFGGGEEEEEEATLGDERETVDVSDEEAKHEEVEEEEGQEEHELTPMPKIRRSSLVVSRNVVHKASFRMVDNAQSSYRKTFARAMGAMKISTPPAPTNTTPATRGGQKKHVLMVRKRPSCDTLSDRNLRSALLGRLRLVCAKTKTYFTADAVTPALVVEFSEARFGQKHRELCLRVLKECALKGDMSVADCRRMKEELAAAEL